MNQNLMLSQKLHKEIQQEATEFKEDMTGK